ncbi:hypothetical protein HAP94_19395 [Acidithiobacillus ferrivorans]|nr:hypothetical protein [Acidithiobacillus ferrivorans]
MWYTHIDTPAVPPPPPAIVRMLVPPAPPVPSLLPVAVQKAVKQSNIMAEASTLLNRPMTAAYAGRADLALAHFAHILGLKLVLRTTMKGVDVALFGQGTVRHFLGITASQMPNNLNVLVNFTTHELVISRG